MASSPSRTTCAWPCRRNRSNLKRRAASVRPAMRRLMVAGGVLLPLQCALALASSSAQAYNLKVVTDFKQFTSQGFFDFNLRGKDVPINHMWTDERNFKAHNHM